MPISLVIAPATADLIAKAAHGLADDLATTLLLATDKKVLVAPAMNLRMWLHPATRRNVAALKRDGLAFVGPNDGEMACGEYGPGRMSEPLEIVAAIAAALEADTAIPLPPGIGGVRHREPASSPASASSSPPARRTSRSIPCAISPTALPASRATPSRRPPLPRERR